MLRKDRAGWKGSAVLAAANVLLVGPMQAARADDKPPGQPSVSVLPFPDPVFKGKIGRTTADSKPDFPQPIQPPAGAPNILLILTDDVGFGASSAFGGPIPTPTLEALAAKGIKYNEFNTTALCSPTRAALLTGRDQHTAHQGIIMERSLGYPGYDSLMPKSTGTIAEILRGNGYSTAWFGKNHNVPGWQSSAAGPFDLWPTGLGFDYFYGFIGGDTDQWDPTLFENTAPIEPKEKLTGAAKANYNLDSDLADQAIHWIQEHHSLAPNKPFFAYYAPGATHAPHHVPKDWIAKFKGQFDEGWDKLRQATFARQKELGVIPQDAVLTPRPANLPAWDELAGADKGRWRAPPAVPLCDRHHADDPRRRRNPGAGIDQRRAAIADRRNVDGLHVGPCRRSLAADDAIVRDVRQSWHLSRRLDGLDHAARVRLGAGA
jgi:hypothetical protein